MVVSESNIIARNPKPIGKDTEGNSLFNEWPISHDVWMENYGKMPDSKEFSEFQKRKSICMVEVDERILKILGSKE
jgi:hypothetical protein